MSSDVYTTHVSEMMIARARAESSFRLEIDSPRIDKPAIDSW